MTAYVKNHRKALRILAKRECALIRAIRSDGRVEEAAEQVRAAQLSVFKMAFARDTNRPPNHFVPTGDARAWLDHSVEEIVAMYEGREPPAPTEPTVCKSARLVIIDGDDRLFLFRYEPEDQPPFWSTAGGQVRGRESYRDAAARELQEETGFVARIGPKLRSREEVFRVAESARTFWLEEYYLVRVATDEEPNRSAWTDEERRTIQAHRWWSLAELRATEEVILPDWLPDLLADTIARNAP